MMTSACSFCGSRTLTITRISRISGECADVSVRCEECATHDTYPVCTTCSIDLAPMAAKDGKLLAFALLAFENPARHAAQIDDVDLYAKAKEWIDCGGS